MKKGFTLLELLTVMAIMVVISVLSTMGYFAAMRGSAARSVAEHMTQTISLARQSAIMNGKKTYLVFECDKPSDPPNSSNAWYYVCMADAATTEVAPPLMYDDFADWSGLISTLVNGTIYNLSDNPVSHATIRKVKATMIETAFPIFTSVGQTYGWLLYPAISLARGFVFQDLPPTLLFTPDGMVLDQATGAIINEQKINIFEKINQGKVAVKITIKNGGDVSAEL